MIADSVTYNSVLVAIVNSSGLPAESGTSTVVNLASAATGIGTVPTTITIPAKTEFASASFNSTYQVGTTIITASAQNLVSARIETSTYGPIPASVVLAPVAASLPANGGNYTGLAIMLQDATGNPAVAPSNILVHLTSSNPSVLKVNAFVNIATGKSSVVTAVQTGISSGVSNISASAVGYKASFTLLSTVIPAPSGVALYIGPATTINATAGSEAVLTAQLQDINGLPARASQQTVVTIVSSNTSVIKGPIILNISPGSDYATEVVNTTGVGIANLTASSAGLSSSFGILTVLRNPVAVTLTSSASIIPDNQTAFITVKAVGLGTGISGAQVKWSTTFGTLSNTSTTTNAVGESIVSLNPGLVANSATVTAIVTSPITGNKTATVSIVFTPIVVPKTPSAFDKFKSYILVIILVLVIAIAAVGFLIFRRRRAAKAPAEGEGEAEQPYDELEEAPQVGEGGDSGNEGVMVLRGSAKQRLTSMLPVRRPD